MKLVLIGFFLVLSSTSVVGSPGKNIQSTNPSIPAATVMISGVDMIVEISHTIREKKTETSCTGFSCWDSVIKDSQVRK